MILCIGATPAAQRVMTFGKLELDHVNRARETRDGIAGKSINVAKVLATLGARPIATGFLGGARGDEILAELSKQGVDANFVRLNVATRQCITVLDQSARTVKELVEESRAVPSEAYDTLLAMIEKILPGCQAVVMSGSLTPGAPTDFYKRITSKATSLGIFSAVDAQGPPLLEALVAGPGLVKPNRLELAATVERPIKNEADILAAIKEVEQRGAKKVVVTAGKNSTLAADETNVWRIEPPIVDAVNPIGSGDAFTAGLVWRLTQNDSLGEACRWAAAAGAANALTMMPGDLELTEVRRLADQVKVERL